MANEGDGSHRVRDLEFDPELRQAMAEILAICARYNCAAEVGLASKTHAEFHLQLPEDSLVSIERDEMGGTLVHFRARKNDPEGTDVAAHMLFSLRDITIIMAKNLITLTEEIEKHITVEHEFLGGTVPEKGH